MVSIGSWGGSERETLHTLRKNADLTLQVLYIRQGTARWTLYSVRFG